MAISKLTGTLVYVQLDTPKPCFDPEKGTEWKASIVVSEDDADEWNDAYPKQKAKEVKTSEFEEIYKIPAPFADQRKQYIITLRKNTKLANGNPVPPQYTPKVFQQKGKTLVEITSSVLWLMVLKVKSLFPSHDICTGGTPGRSRVAINYSKERGRLPSFASATCSRTARRSSVSSSSNLDLEEV